MIYQQSSTFRGSRAVATTLCLCLIGMLAGCAGSDGAGSGSSARLLLAAASTEEAVLAASESFARSGLSLQVSAGASNALAQQVLAGAPAHLFLSANEQWADSVFDQGLVIDSVPLLSNRLVVVVPLGNPAGVEGLAGLSAQKIDRLAIAGESVPAGIYAQDALASMFLLEELEAGKRLVRGQDVRQTLAFVEQAEVDAGIVYQTDARVSDRVEVVEVVDLRQHDTIVYRLLLLADDEVSRSLFEYLQSDQALEIFERFGFDRVHSLTVAPTASLDS